MVGWEQWDKIYSKREKLVAMTWGDFPMGLGGGKAKPVIAIAYSHGGAVRGRAEGGSGQT
jgi:hypothetical protein